MADRAYAAEHTQRTSRLAVGLPRKPLQLSVLVLVLYAAFFAYELNRHRGDVTAFVTAGDHFVQAGALVAPIRILPNSTGYDGLFYYRLALDPFTTRVTDFGITLDNPATRMQRIGYPFLAWVASFGQPHAVPWVMVGLNLAGLFIIAWLATGLARFSGLPAWLGLAVPLYPGFLLSLSRDTTEIVAAAFAFAALSLVARRWFWAAGCVAALAVMTRETTLLYLAGYGLVAMAECARQRRWSWILMAFALPAVVFVLWQWTLIRMWGDGSFSGTGQNLGLPFAGFVSYLGDEIGVLSAMQWRGLGVPLHAFYLASAAACVGFCVLAGVAAMRGRAAVGLKISWLLYLVMAICFTTAIWVEPFDYMRVCSDLFVMGATIVMLSGRVWLSAALLALTVPTWVATVWYARLIGGL